MRKIWIIGLLALGLAALAGCARGDVGKTAVSGPALIMFYTDN